MVDYSKWDRMDFGDSSDDDSDMVPTQRLTSQDGPTNIRSTDELPAPKLAQGERIDVYYGRTDNTTGYKEYSCVVVQTAEHTIEYYDDVYDPRGGCKYKVLYEVPMNRMHFLYEEGEKTPSRGFVPSPLKERVLKYWKFQRGSRCPWMKHRETILFAMSTQRGSAEAAGKIISSPLLGDIIKRSLCMFNEIL